MLSSSKSLLARIIGSLVNGPYFGSVFAHFFISFNRFCAVVYPMKYNRLWSKSKATIAGIFSWLLGTFISIGNLCEDCSLIFNQNSSYRFFYDNSYYGQICSNIDSAISIIAITIMACTDSITLIKILAYRATMRENTTTSTDNAINQREVLFFKQSCMVNFIYIVCVLLFMAQSFLFTNKWLLFLTSTILWILLQSVDGIAFLIINRKMIWKTSICGRSSIVAPATTTYRLQTTIRH
ncbi:hypothetical protein LOAG_13010 [Loa loa]|uniref:G-protein coupled receptors family 1 profile domain-containing protein n=1 Tax=Loa loa TaxID=7209 RepID=A0A1S0TLL5_LOALO|nr:hypothetical protein LOAG_13010 [Loa loa]EFO15498.2 hypothetical protein LOAG_13010 [Loa loa]